MAWRGRERKRGYRRTALAAVMSSGILLVGLGPTRDAGASAGAPAQAFSNGQAKATALVVKVAPGVGALELAMASGIAVAELKNNLTQSQATALDLGLVGSVLTAGSECSDRPATFTPDDLPQPTRVDNRDGPAHAEEAEAPIGDFGGAGYEIADAEDGLSSAVATTAFALMPGVTINGGQARSTTRVIDGAAREARAEVSLSIDIGGVLQLSGLRWEAIHRTGAEPSATAEFDIGTAKLFNLPIPLDSLVQLEELVNTALAPVGVAITFPKVERFTEPADLVRITPLRIAIRDGQLGEQAISPVLNATRAERENLYTTIATSLCEAASVPLLADIGLSIAAGTGFLYADIGGAEALSGDLLLTNPFGPPIAPSSPLAPPAPSPPVQAPSLPGGPTTPPVVDAPPAADGPPTTPVADVGPLEKVCETVHPFSSPGCSEGAMVPLGLAGLVATAGIGALDWRHQRRRAVAAVIS